MRKTTEMRIDAIQAYLLEHKKVKVNELSSMLGVTPEMIRKDLSFLEEKGFLFRTHGGAVVRDSNVDIPIAVRSKEKVDTKKRLCHASIQFINNDDVVFIDPSSTHLYLGQLVQLKKNLVIVTNCFDFMDNAKNSSHDMYFLGGKYSKTGNRTEGQFQLNMINRFSYDVALFGLDGFTSGDGVGTNSMDAVFLNMDVIARSKKNILVMDSSKFDISARYSYADLSQFDVLITDVVPEEWRNKIPCKKVIEIDKM